MDYRRLSIAEVRRELEAVSADVQTAFRPLTNQQLNWCPAADQWSVAQCLEHLLATNRMMLEAAEDAWHGRKRTVWQRLPVLPSFWGGMLVKSQSPDSTRRFKTTPAATPTSSAIDDGVVTRFVEQHRTLDGRLAALDDQRAARVIMTSPFASFIAYSLLDGFRLIAAHDRRHLAQAHRVVGTPGFPV